MPVLRTAGRINRTKAELIGAFHYDDGRDPWVLRGLAAIEEQP